MTETKLWLASTSPRRRELIQNLGLEVAIVENTVDEALEEVLTPEEVVTTLARRKMTAAYKKIEGEKGVIVAGDTIVVHNNKILGKPKDREDAFRMLSLLEGDTHDVFSGVACKDVETGMEIVRYSATKVKMKSLTTEQIHHYIESGEPMDKAGAYAIQGLGATIVEKIDGDYFTVVGLPLSTLADMLGELGITVL